VTQWGEYTHVSKHHVLKENVFPPNRFALRGVQWLSPASLAQVYTMMVSGGRTVSKNFPVDSKSWSLPRLWAHFSRDLQGLGSFHLHRPPKCPRVKRYLLQASTPSSLLPSSLFLSSSLFLLPSSFFPLSSSLFSSSLPPPLPVSRPHLR
jgi:hypothetical protein